MSAYTDLFTSFLKQEAAKETDLTPLSSLILSSSQCTITLMSWETGNWTETAKQIKNSKNWCKLLQNTSRHAVKCAGKGTHIFQIKEEGNFDPKRHFTGQSSSWSGIHTPLFSHAPGKLRIPTFLTCFLLPRFYFNKQPFHFFRMKVSWQLKLWNQHGNVIKHARYAMLPCRKIQWF